MANPTLLTMPLCVNADKNTIPPTDAGTSGLFSEELGWQEINSLPLASGGKAPNRRDFNGVFALLGGIAYACQRGYTFTWDSTQDYEVGCVVLDTNDNKRYECISDVTANATPPSNDTTHWKEFKTGGGGAVIGSYLLYPSNSATLPEGYLECNGQAVSRTMYPDLFAVIGTTYGVGDGTTTFNLPDFSDGKFFEGSTTAGTVKSAGLPNITGNADVVWGGYSESSYTTPANIDTSGALNSEQSTKTPFPGVNLGSVSKYIFSRNLQLDASNSNAVYGNSNTVQPYSCTVRVLIKAFDGQTPDSALIDITQYANELANKADRSLSNLTAEGESKLASSIYTEGFTIIYPNGGTESNPANVSLNSRYVETNPFAGYYVYCLCELLINNKWTPFAKVDCYSNLSNGIWASQYDGNIVVQTAKTTMYTSSVLDGNPAGLTSDSTASLPCRVKVWKIGKIPT